MTSRKLADGRLYLSRKGRALTACGSIGEEPASRARGMAVLTYRLSPSKHASNAKPLAQSFDILPLPRSSG